MIDKQSYIVCNDDSQKLKIYQKIISAIKNIEKVEEKDHLEVLQYTYPKATKRSFFNLGKPAFTGTFDEYCKSNPLYLKYSLAYNRLNEIKEVIQGARTDNNTIYLSFSDVNFINKCNVPDKLSSYYHNISLE